MVSPEPVRISVVIPAFNEEAAIADTVRMTRGVFGSTGVAHEIIVVDDGSSDRTAEIAEQIDVAVVRLPQNGGYGTALKAGIRRAQYDWIAILDADGTYPVDKFSKLMEFIPAFDMVVGARTGRTYYGSYLKYPVRLLFKRLCEFVTGREIPDINSGMRLFRKDVAMRHFERISGGFSFTTTLTLAMMMEGHFVKYVPVSYHPRIGKSHVKYIRDTLRAAQIIIQAINFYNPVKLFVVLMAASLLCSLAAVIGGVLWCFHPALILLWAGLQVALLLAGCGLIVEALRHNAPRK